MNPFPIDGTQLDKHIPTRLTKEFMEGCKNLKSKKLGLSELPIFWKNQPTFMSLLEFAQTERITNIRFALWVRFYSRFTLLTIPFWSVLTDSVIFTNPAYTHLLDILTIEDFMAGFLLTILLILDCLCIWMGIRSRRA